MIRVVLPYPLRELAEVSGEVRIELDGPATLASLIDALEGRYPALRGTLRDPATGRRRPFLRFFACREDLSQEPLEAPLPEAVVSGAEPLVIVGAVAGGCGEAPRAVAPC